MPNPADSSPIRLQSPLRTLAAALAVAAAYYVSGKIGLSLAFVNASATAVWPPTGIALAALLVLGYRVWPGILLGAFLVNLTTAGTIASSIGIATGNTLECLLGAWLINRFANGRHVLERPRDVFKFMLLAGLLAPVVSATIGVTTLCLSGLAHWPQYAPIWLTWWLGDSAGALVITPFLLLWASEPRLMKSRRPLEAFALLGTTVLVGQLVFGVDSALAQRRIPIAFLCFPVLTWAAFRFTQRGASTSTLMFSAIAIWGTLHGAGPFAGANQNDSLLLLQTFMGIISVMILMVSANVSDRRRIAANLRRLNEQLEAHVAERTEQLSRSNQELRDEMHELALTQRDLEYSEARLREAQEVAHVGSWEWDIDPNTLWWSQELYAIYGVDPQAFDASYEAYLECVHPDDRDRVVRTVEAAFRDGQPFSFEHRIVRPDGAVLTLHGRGRVVIGAQGKPIRMVGTGQDITERQRLEEQREHLIQEQVARREAEEANRQKDEFLAMLSHELRTPLNSIGGWAELLRTGQLDAATTERAIETIRRNVKTQDQLISDLLDISRMTSGRIVLKKQPLALAEVIERALDTIRPAARARGLELIGELDGAMRPVIGDPNRLEQVISNLVTNAIAYTPEGGVVRVRLDAIGDQARIRVEDTGVGISPEFLPYVFDRYRQGNSATVHTQGGLGLGLAIVKHLVEFHGGSVRAANRDGEPGAIFTIMLPLEGVPGTDGRLNDSGDKATAATDKARTQLSGLRIMIVDDDQSSLEPLSMLFSRRGAEVVTAGSSAEALASIVVRPPDVLISDIEMPGVNGYDLMLELRSLARDRGGAIPAIALTAYAGAENAGKALRAGYDAHFTKPVQIERLMETVARLARPVPIEADTLRASPPVIEG